MANKIHVVLAAVVPALAVGALLIAVIAWRERAALTENRDRLDATQRQLDDMHRLGDALASAKDQARQWHERWENETKALTDDLGKANQALTESVHQQERAKAAIEDLSKQLADINARLQALQDAKTDGAKPEAIPPKK